MGILGTEELKEGMILASDLRTLEGRTILEAGQSLTAQAIRTCTVWGVNEADVIDAPTGKTDPNPPEEQQAIAEPYKKLTVHRFRLADTKHPAIRVLAHDFAEKVSKTISEEQAETLMVPYGQNHCEPLPGYQDMKRILRENAELVSLPAVFHEITDALRNPCSSAAYVAEIISKDVALSAKLLRMVNTPFYGFPRKIDTLSRAVTIVGTNQLTSLALGISVISSFNNIPEDLIRVQDFWLQSITCGSIARLLAVRTGIPGDERFFVAALLHNVGRLLLLRNQPDMVRSVLEQAHACAMPLHELEKQCWGWDHCELGAALLKQWKLPVFIEHQVRHHHTPQYAIRPEEAAVTHVAEVASHAIIPAHNGAPYIPSLNPEAWDRLGISGNDLLDIINQANQQAKTVMAAFFNE